MTTEYLEVTLIDVGWGDSILVEFFEADADPDGERANRTFGLIDSNDEPGSRLSYDFINRYWKTSKFDPDSVDRAFKFVLLTHWHADHGSGLEHMIRKFGTDWFWYPKADEREIAKLGSLYNYSIKAKTKIGEAHAVDNRPETAFSVNGAKGRFLWPPDQDGPKYLEENHASVVMDLSLGDIHFLLTGDCEAENWPKIKKSMPKKSQIRMFKVPHHGSQNGVFDMTKPDSAPWLDMLAKRTTKIAMSSHISPFKHPHPRVVAEFNKRKINPLRTDHHYHLTFRTDGKSVETKWARF